jgi:hypothetical protein
MKLNLQIRVIDPDSEARGIGDPLVYQANEMLP